MPTEPSGDNRLAPEDLAVHSWYRFVLAYPPHLVRQYLERFALAPGALVLDPFCGTGTTLVECRKLGYAALGVEANPVAHFASGVKCDWSPDPQGLRDYAEEVSEIVRRLPDQSLRTLPPERMALLLHNSVSPLPLHRVLCIYQAIANWPFLSYMPHALLALARVLVEIASNLRFGPEVGLGTIKQDAPVEAAWRLAMLAMADDLEELPSGRPVVAVVLADARDLPSHWQGPAVQAVITSPPYPNEKDYSRTTRLESVVLGFTPDKQTLQAQKRTFLRSNTRGMYTSDTDDLAVQDEPEVQRLAQTIELRRLQLGKTSGFERRYARLVQLYFGGMARHLAGLRGMLAPGARLAYVVGDQASYLQVMIRTGQITAQIAERLGYQVEGIDLFRTRAATATRALLREEVVVLRWPGPS